MNKQLYLQPTDIINYNQQQANMLLPPYNDLSDFCSSMVQTLCNSTLSVWEDERIIGIDVFCKHLFTQINIPDHIVYTGLKYLQCYLAAEMYDCESINVPNIAHEHSLFTVSLLLAYKFLEDNPPYMSQWSIVSMIPLKELSRLEAHVLQKIDYSLNISSEELDLWTGQCNAIYSLQPCISQEQLELLDLHMTTSRLGYSKLLRVDIKKPSYIQPLKPIFENWPHTIIDPYQFIIDQSLIAQQQLLDQIIGTNYIDQQQLLSQPLDPYGMSIQTEDWLPWQQQQLQQQEPWLWQQDDFCAIPVYPGYNNNLNF